MNRRIIVTSEYFRKIFRKIRFPFPFIAGLRNFISSYENYTITFNFKLYKEGMDPILDTA